ncbi:hypothetical protein [Shimwellia blattae]|uniref:Uncharacterized protein n=1 Tax=Shimwellia blattae (strain ATCC 29907 / DSM 4481 / JCM 1650 / NBRC 105725 / CDC 9005-74) TaxID=630626 RepID=I2B3T6_SHIBC|nr:hypothetical protein [Shimwellia blattae]AFJ45190.1 hypothetical protein EBL_c00530 [Shimwellia blattae DSM 4481 = NBRC 105725]GAB80695.1 hypothetical protein EB105725_07_01080 [Shimwellia blattae DSM 4481 = NBRC 105725]VDY62669.1 Uncharacterised protein [Shimwellia blattae]VEC19404.1 Uncharacterised protein [Shimwellia blattae]
MDAALVEQIYQSMTQMNDAVLYKAPSVASWTLHGNVIQGIPSGDAAPDYWRNAIINSANPAAQKYVSGDWKAIAFWFVAYPAATSTATLNGTRIAVSDVALWALFSDPAAPRDIAKAQWKQIRVTTRPSWAANYDFNLVDYIADTPNLSTDDTANIYQLDAEMHPIHGGTDIVCIAADCASPRILGTFVQLKAWLPESSPGNKVLISVGADYYPDKSVRAGDLTGAGYLPGAYGSRYQTITTTPRYIYAANVTDPDARDSRGNLFYDPNTPYSRNGGKTWLTREELQLNPPPVQAQK